MTSRDEFSAIRGEGEGGDCGGMCKHGICALA